MGPAAQTAETVAGATRVGKSKAKAKDDEEKGGAKPSKRFGMYLRKLREERKLSLDDVENQSSEGEELERITKSHLSRIENAQAILNFPRMFTLCKIYGMPVATLAERWELSVKLDNAPPEIAAKPTPQILDEAKALRVKGRHGEALHMYGHLLDREADGSAERIDVTLEYANCLIKTSRERSAKERCEWVIEQDPAPRQKVVAHQLKAIACYRLGLYRQAQAEIDSAEKLLPELESPDLLAAHLSALKGNVHYIKQRFDLAADAYRTSWKGFEALSNPFEACRMRLNLGAALMEMGSHATAREHFSEVIKRAESAGYDRQKAFALSHLGLMAYRENDHDRAEKLCYRSNHLARPRDYKTILFRNCYYLWKIAGARQDSNAITTNKNTLRSLQNSVEGHVPEVQEFKKALAGRSGQ